MATSVVTEPHPPLSGAIDSGSLSRRLNTPLFLCSLSTLSSPQPLWFLGTGLSMQGQLTISGQRNSLVECEDPCLYTPSTLSAQERGLHFSPSHLNEPSFLRGKYQASSQPSQFRWFPFSEEEAPLKQNSLLTPLLEHVSPFVGLFLWMGQSPSILLESLLEWILKSWNWIYYWTLKKNI